MCVSGAWCDATAEEGMPPQARVAWDPKRDALAGGWDSEVEVYV
jgi:hypothetical protein